MFELEKNFERAIRKLKSPTSRDFKPGEWQNAFDTSGAVEETSKRLLEVALWIGKVAAAGRVSLTTPELDDLDSKTSTLLAVASMNREFLTAQEQIHSQLKQETPRPLLVDDLASMTLMTGIGVPASVSAVTEVYVDAGESWLYDAYLKTGGTASSGDITSGTIKAIEAYTWRKSLNGLWNKARWEGWYLQATDARQCMIPADLELEKLIVACLGRQESNLLAFPAIDRLSWRSLDSSHRRQIGLRRSVVEASRIKGKARLKIATLQYLSKYPPAFVEEKGSLESSHLAEFLEVPMPLDRRLTPLLLLRAWHVLTDAASTLAQITPLPKFLDATKVTNLALAVPKSEISHTLSNALQIDVSTADAIVDFLTFKPQGGTSDGHKGLWSAPLVYVPGSDLYALPLPVLRTSNCLRKLEAWLQKGGIDDSNPLDQRGDRYESNYRASLCRSLARNPSFKTAKCAPLGIAKSEEFEEQIDILCAFGGTAIVGEVKFFLMPTEPRERSRYFGKLREAAAQVLRKANALESRRDVIAKALDMPLSESQKLRIIPLIITNQGFLFSMQIDGVRIVEAEFLRTYLSAGELVIGMATDSRTGESTRRHHEYYSTEAQAARRIEHEIAKPYVLGRFIDRVRFRKLETPTFIGPNLNVIEAFLAAPMGEERMQQEELVGDLSR